MRSARAQTVANYLVLTVLSAIVLLPVVGLVGLSVHPRGSAIGDIFTFDNLTLATLKHAWNEGDFSSALRNSAIVATSVTVISLLIAVPAGYAFGVLRPPGSDLVFYLFIAGLIVPLEAYVVPLYYQLRDLSLLDTRAGLIVPLSAQMLPFGVFWMRAQFRSMPTALIDAARVDGASSVTVLARVLLPLVRPGVASLAVLTFLWAWNDFLLALFMISSEQLRTAPLQLGLFVGVRTSDISSLAGAALIVSLPVIVVYVFFQRRLIHGLMEGGVKE